MEKAIFFLIIFASNYIVVQLFMITSEFLNLLDITESDLQFDLRGYYSTSFFHVYLEGEFDTDIKRLSIKDRGTFIHEYIHYFQNIGTYWGLYCSIIRYHEMLEFKAQIIDSDIIEIPLNLNYSEKLRAKIEWVKAGNGLSVYNSNLTWNINKEHKIEIKQTDSNICGRNRPQIYLNIMFDDGRVESVDFGAHIIKESMAALYQSLVDASVLHNDVPYNIVKLVCEQYFPNIANDVEKLICLCYTSLFSMSPGSELFSLLKVASENIQTNGVDLFTNFIDSKTITTSQGKTHTVVDFFDILINGFKRTLSTNLVADLDYIDNVLDRVKLSNKWIPFLSVLYDQNKLSIENINAIIGFIGIPYIQTSTHGFHFPQSTKEGCKDASLDVLEMIAQEALFSYITHPQTLKMCPLFYMCGATTYNKDGCFKSPWEKPECSFTIVSEPLAINKKEIRWSF